MEWPDAPKGYRIVLKGLLRKGDLVLQSSGDPKDGYWREPSVSYYALARKASPRRPRSGKGRRS